MQGMGMLAICVNEASSEMTLVYKGQNMKAPNLFEGTATTIFVEEIPRSRS